MRTGDSDHRVGRPVAAYDEHGIGHNDRDQLNAKNGPRERPRLARQTASTCQRNCAARKPCEQCSGAARAATGSYGRIRSDHTCRMTAMRCTTAIMRPLIHRSEHRGLHLRKATALPDLRCDLPLAWRTRLRRSGKIDDAVPSGSYRASAILSMPSSLSGIALLDPKGRHAIVATRPGRVPRNVFGYLSSTTPVKSSASGSAAASMLK